MSLTLIYKILLTFASYLLGSFPTAFVILKLKTGGDIRYVGSGNVGGTNVTRIIGIPMGVLTILADIVKGFLPALVSYLLFPGDIVLLSVLVTAAVLGHDFSIYLKFKGGKGIATSFGAIVGLCSLPFNAGHVLWLRLLPIFIILMTWAIVFLASRIVSLASLGAAISTPLAFYFSKHPIPVVIASICFFILTFIAHRDNIKRLIKKEEKRLKRKGA